MKAQEARKLVELKASEVKYLTELEKFLKKEMPQYYSNIEAAAKQGQTSICIGKPDGRIIDKLRKDGYNINYEDDGDYHSARVLRYWISW